MQKRFKIRGRGKKPTPDQTMLILKYGLDPYEWNVVWQDKDTLALRNRITDEKELICL